MIRQLSIYMKKNLLLLTLAISPALFAERPEASNPYAYIAKGGPLSFSKSGAAYLPATVLDAVRQKKISPVMQLVLENHILSECVEKVLKEHPYRRDPFVVAKAKFDDGICKIGKCYQQATLISLLSTMGSAQQDTGADNNQFATIMAQAFQKQKGCGNSEDNGMDPMMLMMILGRK